MKPTDEEQREHEIELWRMSLESGNPDQEIIGWTANEQGGREPVTRLLFRWLREPERDRQVPEDWTEPNKRAERLKWFADSLDAAEVAYRKNHIRQLKKLSDQIRNVIGEIPTRIPDGGFDDVDAMAYEEWLTPETLKSRIYADLEARGWLAQFLRVQGSAK